MRGGGQRSPRTDHDCERGEGQSARSGVESEEKRGDALLLSRWNCPNADSCTQSEATVRSALEQTHDEHSTTSCR